MTGRGGHPDGDAPASSPPDVAAGTGAQEIPSQREVAGAPATPFQLGGTGWWHIVKRAMEEFAANRCTMTAGSLAYHWFLAIFPALIALLGLTSLAHVGQGTVTRLVNGLNNTLPPGASDVFIQAVHSATSQAASGSLTAVLLGTAVATWSASGGMAALETALDITYNVDAQRKILPKRLYTFPLMLATVVLGGAAAALLVFDGPIASAIEPHVPLAGTAFAVGWTIARWVVTIIAISLLFSIFYYLGPNRPTPRWQWASLGGVIGSLIFLASAAGFSVYVSKFGNFGKAYGAFAGVAILIFWLYLIGIAVMLGGEINAEAEREAAAQAGDPQARAAAEELDRDQPTAPPATR